MIYVDTSVALAHLLAEDRRPATTLWDEPLILSRLLEYELWTRIHARCSPRRTENQLGSSWPISR